MGLTTLQDPYGPCPISPQCRRLLMQRNYCDFSLLSYSYTSQPELQAWGFINDVITRLAQTSLISRGYALENTGLFANAQVILMHN